MLSSITPLGERGRGGDWRETVSLFIGSSALGGAVMGAIAGWLGAMLENAARDPDLGPALLGALAVGGVVLDLRLFGARLPSIRRQVDRRWLDRYKTWAYAVGFGFQLGIGLGTIVTASAIYLSVAAAFLTRSPVGGLVVGLVFGLVRGAMVLLGHSIDSTIALYTFHEQLDLKYDSWKRFGLLAQLLVAVAILLFVVEG
jgi:MFS family permease